MPWHSALLFLIPPFPRQIKKREKGDYPMENRNVSDLLQQYAQQTENANSLANGEVEAKDTCGNCCDCKNRNKNFLHILLFPNLIRFHLYC